MENHGEVSVFLALKLSIAAFVIGEIYEGFCYMRSALIHTRRSEHTPVWFSAKWGIVFSVIFLTAHRFVKYLRKREMKFHEFMLAQAKPENPKEAVSVAGEARYCYLSFRRSAGRSSSHDLCGDIRKPGTLSELNIKGELE
ncbi:hypothetical protein QUF72_09610 [Desulfobacterales bacterium HSG2]|nr:hypothetical protein [Desulfobacterales bacterium HSG2]